MFRTNQHKARVRHTGGGGLDERLIDPLMEAPDVADDRARKRSHLGRHVGYVRQFEGLDADPRRKQVNVLAISRRALAQLFGRDKNQIGRAEQVFFAGHDALRVGGARRKFIDTVIDRGHRSELADQVEHERRRQECPDDRARKAGRPDPARQAARHQLPIDPPRDPRVRQWQDERRIHEQIGPLLAESLRAAPPVAQAVAYPADVAHAQLAHAGVLDEQDPVPILGEARHDLLVTLPDEVPVDRRDADDVVAMGHRAPPWRLRNSAS